jgi:ribonucleoside-diphosphate reductase alpha chain
MLSKTANKILERKYLKEDEDFDALCARVAMCVSEAEETKAEQDYFFSKFFQLMRNRWFMPAGRILANAGTENGNLYNCGVLGIEDSRESIFDTLKTSAEVFAHGGGLGINFSPLREYGAPVSTGAYASGPVSFMHMFDRAASVMSQTSRRGGFLGVLEPDHPDIIKFITAKQDEESLPHFNISVGITDDFMQAVKEDKEWNLISRYDGSVVETLPARNLFNKIAECAWNTGEPGILFLDRINRDNSTPHLGEIKSTNLCGEEPLYPYEMCDLGSINLVKMLSESDGELVLDETKLVHTTTLALRFLDNVHDVTSHILPEVKEVSLCTRKTGLGVMGFADVLMQLEIPYDSQEARDLARMISTTIKSTAYQTSALLADIKSPYPAYDENKSQNIWYENRAVTPTRNSQMMSLAPTGSISLASEVNSGIEPYFALTYTKNVTEGEHETKYVLKETKAMQYIEDYLRRNNVDNSEEILEKIAEAGTANVEGAPEELSEIFKTAHEISPEDHVRMQAAWQKDVDGSISKTINMPNSASIKDVESALMLAYDLDLKGLTVYRDACRKKQIMEKS